LLEGGGALAHQAPELGRRFGVNPTIGYRLSAVGVLADGGQGGLADRSRRPQHSPERSSTAMEGLVLAGGALDR
jgi:hypothetical protein